MKNKIIILSVIGIFGIANLAQAQTGFWKLTSNRLEPVVSTWDVKISGDDLFMATNTDAFILVANGTNYNPVAMSGDITITNAGVTAIGADKVMEADLKAVDAAVDEECLTYETTTGDFEWQTCGAGGTGDVTDVGPGCATGACWTDGLVTAGTDLLIWEGITADTYEFSIVVPSDPTADVAITMPTTTGTLVLTTGNVATATALAADPTDCAAGNFANAIAASGNLTCDAEADPNVDTEAEIEAITGALFGASKAVTAGYIWVADGVDFESVAMSGDCTIASSGAIECTQADALETDPTDCAANTFADAINASGTLTCNSVVSADITADTITHANILDADQADTKCLWFEDPVAADDFKSIWANKTANDFQVTEIWGESDQTVTFMLQLDDGTPADCDTVDLGPAAGEAEDTALDGDCLVAAGEELDLDIASVANTPTWVSICWTGNWAD